MELYDVFLHVGDFYYYFLPVPTVFLTIKSLYLLFDRDFTKNNLNSFMVAMLKKLNDSFHSLSKLFNIFLYCMYMNTVMLKTKLVFCVNVQQYITFAWGLKRVILCFWWSTFLLCQPT